LNSFKELFLLDPQIIFLNHGSFGATPLPVFECYQSWQRQLEKQPVAFLGRQVTSLMEEARTKLADYLGVQPDEIIYFSNPTTAINMVARNLLRKPDHLASLQGIRTVLQPDDEILTTNHEYGAMDRTWRYICHQTGARYVCQPMPLPLEAPENFVERFWQGVNQHTRVIFLSHITSPTALIFPVKAICERARKAGILSIVDGAHAPGQIDVNLQQVGADIYAGACHKWLCAPKGAAFLYVRRELQGWLDPLVVSWGYESELPSDSQFVDYHEWQGTRDLAAFLTVPDAIDFQKQHNWQHLRQECHAVAVQARKNINAYFQQADLCPEQDFAQMFSVQLPEDCDLDKLKDRLYQEYAIEVPVMAWQDLKLLRVSIQVYNTAQEVELLQRALQEIIEKP
jgi:isopenicillin-N epimerase